ncbi:FTR1 family iron permease [Microbulbifer sediminum]|uniref:FTR1 family iron permease n=1 Tax=Microbulbifer sediminum TaxID=2904250 RepID=UPI001F01D741|nr:FTR1 family protein [Microbulbifer sediminum]
MFSSAIIVFREVLEAALVITIVLAATQGVLKRHLWIGGGVAAGVAGAVVVASIAEGIAMSFEGIGQELFNAAVLFSAVAMLAWHNLWMSRHARTLVAHLKRVGSSVSSGELPMYFLSTAVGLAVLREGSEIVLFMHGFAAGGSNGVSMLTGGLLGLAGGCALGALIYFGLLRIPTTQLFRITGWLILFLAAGMAASAAGYLMQAGVISGSRPLWNTSDVVSQHSFAGQVLHVLVGYQDRPTAVHLSFYLATLVLIGLGMHLTKQKDLAEPDPSTMKN